uniref:Uncharacterized protein n=1 Tax=Meloidogyne enterolobii TaxID=390850 RepID=A0A6V7TPP6_MELEN|nr:unnamed protein product [Meloidogyne enterolobii]
MSSSSSSTIILYNENPKEASKTTTIINSSPIQLSNGSFVWLNQLNFNLADNMEQCFQALTSAGLPIAPNQSSDSLPWCNATWDTVLCWPATQGGQSVTLQCPPLKGLDPSKTITKYCHSSGNWMGKTENDFSRPHGWTNFTMCFTREVVAIMQQLDNGTLYEAQEVAKNARKLEFVGLGLSLISLLFCVAIFTSFRRLRVFRNLLHLHLMIAILAMVLLRLVLYIDLIFTDRLGHQQLVNPQGRTINTMVFVCELMFFLLEYFKSVAFWWMFLEGLFLHNQLVLAVFNTTPHLWPYLLTGYGVPFIHTLGWLIILFIKKNGKLERCLGSYYLEVEFWILDGPRLAQLVINTLMLINVIRVLWLKVRDSRSSSELQRTKKSVKAALMLIPLLGIPNIMQTIPFSPTQDNITYFAIWTYCASFTYMYQGFMIAIIYCFTNREVQTVLKNCYNRHRLKHSRPLDRHKGGGSHYTQIASKYNNNNNSSSNGINNNNDNEKQRGGKLVSGGQIASVDSGERFLFIRSKMIQELEDREGGNNNIKQLNESKNNINNNSISSNHQYIKRCSLPINKHKRHPILPSTKIKLKKQLSIHQYQETNNNIEEEN